MNEEIITISTEDVEITAAVKVKGQTLQCVVYGFKRKWKNGKDTTEYYGAVNIEGEEFYFRLTLPNRPWGKKAIIQIKSRQNLMDDGLLEINGEESDFKLSDSNSPRDKGAINRFNNGDVIAILAKGVEITVTVKIKQQIIKYPVSQVERMVDGTWFHGYTEIEGEKYNIYLAFSNKRQATVEFYTIKNNNEGFYVIPTEDVEMTAVVEVKGQTLRCPVWPSKTEIGGAWYTIDYFGMVEIEGKEHNIKIERHYVNDSMPRHIAYNIKPYIQIDDGEAVYIRQEPMGFLSFPIDIIAALKVKGQTAQCRIRDVEFAEDAIEYRGYADIGDDSFYLKLYYPKSKLYKEAVIELISVLSTGRIYTIPVEDIEIAAAVKVKGQTTRFAVDGAEKKEDTIEYFGVTEEELNSKLVYPDVRKRDEDAVVRFNDGEIITIPKKDAEITATVKVKGHTVQCAVGDIEKTEAAIVYSGFAIVGNREYYFKLEHPNSKWVKEGTFQFHSIMNSGQIVDVTKDDIEIAAAVKIKGQTVRCVVKGAERSIVANEYFGVAEIEGEINSFKIVEPHSSRVKVFTIQFNDEEIIEIPKEELDIIATVIVKGQPVQSIVCRVEKFAVSTDYHCGTYIGGRQFNSEIMYPNSEQVKEATIQFNSI